MAVMKVLGGYLDVEGAGVGEPSHPIVTPPPYPDQGLPPGSPGSPSHPIYIPGAPPGMPGHPAHPIYIGGSPSHPIYIPGYPTHPIVPPGGSPSHPIYLPVYPSHPIEGVGPGPSHPIALPPGGTPVPPDTINPPLPEPPPEYANQTIVAVKHPGQDWKVATYDVGPDQGMPAPTPH